MKAATYNGVLTSNVPPIRATCSTGNCTWPVTPSLAICGECIRSTYEISCNSNTDSSMNLSVGIHSPCFYTLPSGMQANLKNFSENDMGVGFQVFASPGARNRSYQPDKLYIANFEVVGAEWRTTDEDGVSLYRGTGAAECALWMCLQAHEV